MDLQISSFSSKNGNPLLNRILYFVESVLRGIGQVMLQNNVYSGVFFLVGIFYNSILFGIAVFVGTIISTATASLLKVNKSQIRDGLFGFNGALVAIALSFFLEPNVLTWMYLIVAAASTTILMAAMLRFFEVWKIPALTAPFVLSSFIFLLACARFGRLHSTQILPTAGLPKAATVEGVVNIMTVIEGVFSGIAQVFFQGNVVTGILFVLGLLVSSRRACVMALLGSAVGILTAWLLGAAEPAIRSGAFSFNPVLTAIALGSVFFPLSIVTIVYSVFGAVVTTIVFAATSGALEPLGMPALTLPFVLVTWLFLLAGPVFHGLLQKSEGTGGGPKLPSETHK